MAREAMWLPTGDLQAVAATVCEGSSVGVIVEPWGVDDAVLKLCRLLAGRRHPAVGATVVLTLSSMAGVQLQQVGGPWSSCTTLINFMGGLAMDGLGHHREVIGELQRDRLPEADRVRVRQRAGRTGVLILKAGFSFGEAAIKRLDQLMRTGRGQHGHPFGGAQIIVVGDPLHNHLLETGATGERAWWQELTCFVTLPSRSGGGAMALAYRVRCDPSAALDLCTDEITPQHRLACITLCASGSTADEINKACVQESVRQSNAAKVVYRATDTVTLSGASVLHTFCAAAEELSTCAGCRVRLLLACGPYLTGQLCTVEATLDKSVMIHRGGGAPVRAVPQDFAIWDDDGLVIGTRRQLPLLLAFAVTVCAAGDATIRHEVIVDRECVQLGLRESSAATTLPMQDDVVPRCSAS